jgi:prepilin-type N-terminal cleavage/methylation domain-containing protein
MIKDFFIRTNHEAGKTRGFSLVETLMSVAIVGVIAVGWTRSMKSANDSMTEANIRQSVVAIEHYLLGFSDCKKTSSASNYAQNCTLNNSVAILDPFGNQVIPNTGRIFGDGQNSVKVTNSCSYGTIMFKAQVSGRNAGEVALFGGIPWYCPATLVTCNFNQYIQVLTAFVDAGTLLATWSRKVTFPSDATDFAISLSFKSIDDHSGRLDVNGVNIFKDTQPNTLIGFNFTYNPVLPISSWQPGVNTLTATAGDNPKKQGFGKDRPGAYGHIGAGFQFIGTYKASSCNVVIENLPSRYPWPPP